MALAAALLYGCGGGSAAQGEATAAARPTPAQREIHDTLRLSRRYMSVLRGPGKRLPRGLVGSGQRREYGAGERGWYATSAGLAGIYLVPARQHLCLLSTNHVSSNCFPLDQVAQGSATSVICSPYLRPGTIEFAGIVPDGARAVTVVRQHGERLRDRSPATSSSSTSRSRARSLARSNGSSAASATASRPGSGSPRRAPPAEA